MYYNIGIYYIAIGNWGVDFLKKALIAFILAITCTPTAYAANIPDHRGTDISAMDMGTKRLSDNVKKYNDIFKSAGDQYGIDPNILAAICMQESSGRNLSYREDGSSYPAWGIMQIEYSHEKAFAAYGLDRTGTAWTLNDRLDPNKAVPYAAYLLSESLYRYNSDYAKMLQAYNFGDTVLMRIIDSVGDNWLSERKNAVKYASNWNYSSYGDALYIEHVLAYYYRDNIPYIGAKVSLNGNLVKFNDQHPIVSDGTTLIPVRAVSEKLDADVKWDGDKMHVQIDKGNKSISLYINSSVAYINDELFSLDVPATVINNRTVIPLRFVAEALDLNVDWDGQTRTVIITQ